MLATATATTTALTTLTTKTTKTSKTGKTAATTRATMTTMPTTGATRATNGVLITTTTTTTTTTKAITKSDMTTASALVANKKIQQVAPMLTTRAIASERTATTPPTTPKPTTITSDPGILCFHHCNVKVFCFHLPHRCPKCKQVLDTGIDDAATAAGAGSDDEARGDAGGGGDESDHVRANNELVSNGSSGGRTRGSRGGGGRGSAVLCSSISTRLLPFRLPYPFIRASQYPCAIVLRPTTGDFLNDYNNSTDLHIAVTTSTGCVVEFDRHGLRRHRADNTRMSSEWWQCLLVGDVPEPWYDYWDDILQQICNQPDRWTISHYQEDSHNCYTFVLAFLQALAYDKLSAAAGSKTSFCEKYIVPRTTTAGKYISLYRKLRDTGIYVHPHQQQPAHLQHHQRFRQQQKQQQQHYYNLHYNQHLQLQHVARGKSRMNGHFNGIGGIAGGSALLANGNKATSIILRAPNLCTIEE